MAKEIETKRERLTGIPGAQVDEVIASYTAEGAIEVNKKKEPDGTWTIEVIFPSV